MAVVMLGIESYAIVHDIEFHAPKFAHGKRKWAVWWAAQWTLLSNWTMTCG